MEKPGFPRPKKRQHVRKSDGPVAESRALKWVQARGGEILSKNYKGPRGEIDLIYRDRNLELVFLEVRARSRGSSVRGLDSVGSVKQRRIMMTAELYLSRFRGRVTGIRFDILEWDGKRIHYFEDVFP